MELLADLKTLEAGLEVSADLKMFEAGLEVSADLKTFEAGLELLAWVGLVVDQMFQVFELEVPAGGQESSVGPALALVGVDGWAPGGGGDLLVEREMDAGSVLAVVDLL